MSRKGETLNISVSPIAKAGLERIAKEHELLWGGKPNISALVEAIGVGQLSVVGDANVTARIAALREDPQVQEFIKLIKDLS